MRVQRIIYIKSLPQVNWDLCLKCVPHQHIWYCWPAGEVARSNNPHMVLFPSQLQNFRPSIPKSRLQSLSAPMHRSLSIIMLEMGNFTNDQCHNHLKGSSLVLSLRFFFFSGQSSLRKFSWCLQILISGSSDNSILALPLAEHDCCYENDRQRKPCPHKIKSSMLSQLSHSPCCSWHA